MKQLGVGICGIGTVGSGTFNLLKKNAGELTRRLGSPPEVVMVAARSNRYECDLSGVNVTSDVFEVARNPAVGVLVELIGGTDTARELVLEAISLGKHIVTANKALLAEHGHEILEAAADKGVQVCFEAAIAGAIPIVKALREGLAGNRILGLAGIINGTSNFILTEMENKKRGFEEVLAEAQRLGYAEADPTFDVEGIDAAHKLSLLSSIAFGVPINLSGAYTEGISHITEADIRFAGDLGYRIKHLGITRRTTQGVELRVHPALVSHQDMLASVSGPMNAILVESDAAGTTMYYGAGAGAKPTASAIVADVIDVLRHKDTHPDSRVPALAFKRSALKVLPVIPIDQTEGAAYLRLEVDDRPGVMASISTILSDRQISIEALIQKGVPMHKGGGHHLPIVLITNIVLESVLDEAIKAIESQVYVHGSVARIRVASLAEGD